MCGGAPCNPMHILDASSSLHPSRHGEGNYSGGGGGCGHKRKRKGGRPKKLLGSVLILAITLIFWNARGINNKDVLFKDLLTKENASYGGVSESKTYEDIVTLSDKRWRWDPGTEDRPTPNTTTINRGR